MTCEDFRPWWEEPRRRGFGPLLPDHLLKITAHAYAMTTGGGLAFGTPECGRLFEAWFYQVCAALGVPLIEQAGSRTLGGHRSASGYRHEMDGGTHAGEGISAWELKHVNGDIPKNALLIFDGKTLDYLRGFGAGAIRTPLYRFVVSATQASAECRLYCLANGIMLIDPGVFPVPLIYEVLARQTGLVPALVEQEHVRALTWGCRSLQKVVCDTADYCRGAGSSGIDHAHRALQAQQVLSEVVADALQFCHPDWESQLMSRVWRLYGGWRVA